MAPSHAALQHRPRRLNRWMEKPGVPGSRDKDVWRNGHVLLAGDRQVRNRGLD